VARKNTNRLHLSPLIESGVFAQTLSVNKTVVNYTTGGDGTAASQNDILTYIITAKNPAASSFSNVTLYGNGTCRVSFASIAYPGRMLKHFSRWRRHRVFHIINISRA
jgi:hypothetical protein